MKKLLRALLVTSIATGVVATAVVLLIGAKGEQPALAGPRGPEELDADRLSPEEREALMQELAAQL